MKRYIRSNVQNKMIAVSQDDLGITLPDRVFLTDNGAYDLEKKGHGGYYAWVGYAHKGSRSDAKLNREIGRLAYNVVAPALADYCNVSEDDVHVDDYINALDMYRVYVMQA